MANRLAKEKSTLVIGLAVFLVTFLVYVTSPVITSHDSRWSVHTSLSIIKEGNTDLNEYEDLVRAINYNSVEYVGEDIYSLFPIGTSALAVPFVAVADALFEPLMAAFPNLERWLVNRMAKAGVFIDDLELINLHHAVELIIASFFCAVAALFIFLVANARLGLSQALLVVFVFAFCTSMWSTSSRSLWQHGPSALMLSIVLYLMLLEEKAAGVIKYAAIPLALAFIIRPTNAIPIVFITLFIALNHRRQLVPFLLIALPLAAVFFAYNLHVYGSWLQPYYTPGRAFSPESFAQALAGNLISPARGLLVYSPVLIFGALWIWNNRNSLSPNRPEVYLLAIVLSHWLLISSFPHWWAGHSYGPRFFADMLPFFIFFFVLFLQDLRNRPGMKVTLVRALLIPLLAVSFFIHAKGAYHWPVHKWNITPTNIDHHPERLWDWQDVQFLR